MKKTVSLGLILLCLIVAVGFAGCIGSDPIVGSWEERLSGVKAVFNADHTATMNVMGITVPGKWDNQGNGEYTITYTAGGSASPAYTCKISNNGKTMTLGFGIYQQTLTKIS